MKSKSADAKRVVVIEGEDAAPDIAGRNIINPTASLLSAAMMLEHLGFSQAGTRVRNAVDTVYANGSPLTPDMGGTATTTEFCDAVASYL